MTETTIVPGEARPAASSGASTTTAPTQFIETSFETYAYRRFGRGAALPLVCLQLWVPQHWEMR